MEIIMKRDIVIFMTLYKIKKYTYTYMIMKFKLYLCSHNLIIIYLF